MSVATSLHLPSRRRAASQQACLTLLLGLILLLAPAQASEDLVTPRAFEQAIFRAFDRGDYGSAVDLLESYIERWPNVPEMHYNLACAYCQLGELEKAESALYRAVESGFRDFEHLRIDPDLEPIRDREIFRAILDANRRVQGDRVKTSLQQWRQEFGGDEYRFEVDEQRKIAFATALDPVSHREMRQMLQRQADHLSETLFGQPPDYFVLVAIPTPRDAHLLFNGDSSVGGRYEHEQRRLIARNIGGSLRHEFVHALHYGHMERLGVRKAHPIWIQEGLAALYEDYEFDEEGRIAFLPNERVNVVWQLAKSDALVSWNHMFRLSPEHFMARATDLYPQARAIFEFVAERGLLVEWYRSYINHCEEDRSGRTALELVFEKPLAQIEGEWRRWAKRRPPMDNVIASGDAALGIESRPHGSNDGVLVVRVFPRSAASRAGLEPGDVIVALNGRQTRSLAELRTLIGARRVGEEVVLRLRRDGEYRTEMVKLEALLRQ